MSTYLRLFRLFKSSKYSNPLEDFTTEIFAGILELYPEIMKRFCNEILDIKEDINFRIQTQKTYKIKNVPESRVDLVLFNDKRICIIENKVESNEGINQLRNYSLILNKFKNEKISTHLFYCTKYFDPKEINEHNFRQFRWHDISNILEEFKGNIQINDFLIFLKKHKMATDYNISNKDLIFMKNYNDITNKLENYLEFIKPIFQSYFGKRICSLDNTSQMRKFCRYVFNKNNIFSIGGSNEIGCGFDFNVEPCLYVWIWSNSGNMKYNEFMDFIANKKYFEITNYNFGGFKMPIKEIINKKDIKNQIEGWYRDKFLQIKKFIDETPELEWNLD